MFEVKFGAKPVPLSVMRVPPAAEPVVGDTLVISRAMVNEPLNAASPPLTFTMILRSSSPYTPL